MKLNKQNWWKAVGTGQDLWKRVMCSTERVQSYKKYTNIYKYI